MSERDPRMDRTYDELDPMTDLIPKRQCTATNRRGERCQMAPIRGGTVCRVHGGSAPQVKAKAQERLKALVDPAIVALGEIVGDKAHPQRLAAAKEILERDGRIGAQQVGGEEALVTYEQLEIIVRRRARKEEDDAGN